ncbi:MAG: FkbM family methyltransferase [Bryobacteraceae bacterium]|nr:FkbM family methyltransferase [Bryobacteraceae bacterium]
MRRIAIILLIAVPVALAGSVYFLYEPLKLSAIVIAGRSPHCPFGQAVRSTAHTRDLMATKDRILASSRLLQKDKNLVQWATPKGNFWIASGNDFFLPFHIAEQETGIYSHPEISLRRGDVVLDCGANVGVYARKALDSGAKLVVAIEPAPETLESLRRNLEREIADGRVIVYPKGVWDKEEELTLYQDPKNTAAASFLHEAEGAKAIEKIPLTTIDKLVEELKLEQVDFIKMDIEGAEPRAVAGARETLQRFRPRMALSTYHAQDHPETVPAAVRAIVPDYRIRCGVCTEYENRIRPDVLFFQ